MTVLQKTWKVYTMCSLYTSEQGIKDFSSLLIMEGECLKKYKDQIGYRLHQVYESGKVSMKDQIHLVTISRPSAYENMSYIVLDTEQEFEEAVKRMFV